MVWGVMGAIVITFLPLYESAEAIMKVVHGILGTGPEKAIFEKEEEGKSCSAGESSATIVK